MIKKILSGILTAALCAVSIHGVFAETATAYKPVIDMSFDSIGEGQVTNYSENGAGAYFDNKTSAWTSGDQAPAGKDGGTEPDPEDRAIKISVGNAKDNPNVQIGLGTGTFQGKLKLSFRFYVPSAQNAGYGLLSVDMRNGKDGQSYSNLFSLRGNKSIQYYPTSAAGSAQNNGTFNVKQWYQVEIYMNADGPTYDIYLDGVLKYENCPMRENVDFNQLRFSVSNSNQTVTDTYVYVDDVFVGMETDRPTPVFSRTLHASGTDGTAMTEISRDMTGIEVEFPYAMDAESFEGNVRLVRGSGAIPVPFEGSYDPETKKYLVTLQETAKPCTEYQLILGKNIKTSNDNTIQHAGVPLTEDEVITLAMEKVDFTVLDAYFTADAEGQQRVEAIGDASDLYANVDYVSTDQLAQNRDLSAFVVVYEGGEMTEVLWSNIAVEPGSGEGTEGRLQITVPAGTLKQGADTAFELVVWDDFVSMTPVFQNTVITAE